MSTIMSIEELRTAAQIVNAISDLELGELDVTVIPQTGYTGTAPIVLTSSKLLGAEDDLVAVTNISYDGMIGDVLVAAATALTPEGKTSPITAEPENSETFRFGEFNETANENRVVSTDRLQFVARFVESVASVSEHSVILFSAKQEGIFATYGISEIGEDITNFL